jgi:hypothetical protein
MAPAGTAPEGPVTPISPGPPAPTASQGLDSPPQTTIPDPAAVGQVEATPNSDRPVPVDDDNSRRPHIGHEIKKGILTAGGALEEFFTGKRTLDRKYREPDPVTPYRGDD